MLTPSPGTAVRLTAAASVLSAIIGLTTPGKTGSADTTATGLEEVALTASQALIMSGTAMRRVTADWMDLVSDNFIEPTIGDGYVNTPLITPEQFRPITGRFSLSLNASTAIGSTILNLAVRRLIAANNNAGAPDDPIAVFGYSQSSWLAAVLKQSLLESPPLNADLPPISVVMLANPVRPNGGLFSRGLGLGLVRWTSVVSAPTDTPFPSYDIARQYDFFADFPTYPLNLLADVNAVFGLLNHDYSSVTLDPADPRYDPATVVQQYGDTTYYLIPSTLPSLYPLRRLGLNRAADAIEPVLKVLVELGYDRQTPYGQHTPFRLFPRVDTATVKSDLQAAFAQSRRVLNSVPAQGKALQPAASIPAVPPVGSTNVAVDIDDAPAVTEPVRPPRAGDVGRSGGQDIRPSRAVAGDSAPERDGTRRRVSRAGST